MGLHYISQPIRHAAVLCRQTATLEVLEAPLLPPIQRCVGLIQQPGIVRIHVRGPGPEQPQC